MRPQAWLESHPTLPLILPLVSVLSQTSLHLAATRAGKGSFLFVCWGKAMSLYVVLASWNSLCRRGWSWTHRIPPVSVSEVLRLKACTLYPPTRWECSILSGFVLTLVRICHKGQRKLGWRIVMCTLCHLGARGVWAYMESWGKRNSKFSVSLRYCSYVGGYFAGRILLPKLTLQTLSPHCPILSSWTRNLAADTWRVCCLLCWF